VNEKEWVNTWKLTGPLLTKLRLEELRRTDTMSAIEAFAGLEIEAIKSFPPGPSSGLVDLQRYLRRVQK